jgi:hypothetical protein
MPCYDAMMQATSKGTEENTAFHLISQAKRKARKETLKKRACTKLNEHVNDMDEQSYSKDLKKTD